MPCCTAARTLSLTDFLTDVLLKDSRQTIAVYNLATGIRFARREAGLTGVDEALLASEKPKALAALERVLVGASKVAVILEYAEAIAPAGDPAFQADADRAAVITFQRWSFCRRSTGTTTWCCSSRRTSPRFRRRSSRTPRSVSSRSRCRTSMRGGQPRGWPIPA